MDNETLGGLRDGGDRIGVVQAVEVQVTFTHVAPDPVRLVAATRSGTEGVGNLCGATVRAAGGGGGETRAH